MSDLDKRSQIVNDPEFLKTALRHIAMGGTLIEYCAMTDIDFYSVREWFNQEESRRVALKQANDIRKEVISDVILAEIRDMAVLDVTEMYNQDGSVKSIQEMPDSIKKAIKSIERDGDKVKVQFVDKLKAIEQLAKTTDLFKEKIEVSAHDSLEALVNASFKRNE